MVDFEHENINIPETDFNQRILEASEYPKRERATKFWPFFLFLYSTGWTLVSMYSILVFSVSKSTNSFRLFCHNICQKCYPYRESIKMIFPGVFWESIMWLSGEFLHEWLLLQNIFILTIKYTKWNEFMIKANLVCNGVVTSITDTTNCISYLDGFQTTQIIWILKNFCLYASRLLFYCLSQPLFI